MGNLDNASASPSRHLIDRVLVTSTDLATPELALIEFLTCVAFQLTAEVIDWNTFVAGLANPQDPNSFARALRLILLRFEDWDHFKDYARNPAIEPSFDIVERKIKDLIFSLDCAAARCHGRIVVGILPPSAIVAQTSELVTFCEHMVEKLRNCLSHHSSITVERLLYRSFDLDFLSCQGSESRKVIYRFPLEDYRNGS